MILTLSDIADHPDLLTYHLSLSDGAAYVLRPLNTNDVDLLADFLENLSLQTRRNYVLDRYDVILAKEFCDAINRYDKLRFVVIEVLSGECIALFEFSLDIPSEDAERFQQFDIDLTSATDCRVGPCIADAFQNRGIGSAVFPYLHKIVHRLGRQRMILWGGVFAENQPAIQFYEKMGFKRLGSFLNQDGRESLDMILQCE